MSGQPLTAHAGRHIAGVVVSCTTVCTPAMFCKSRQQISALRHVRRPRPAEPAHGVEDVDNAIVGHRLPVPCPLPQDAHLRNVAPDFFMSYV